MGIEIPGKKDDAAGAIELARVMPFAIGALDIYPAIRQLKRGARSETVEPRVMQVLVALAHRKGEVVSRDDLIASCWDGRIVGDNAIHRVISRLREIAATIGDGCFALETVNKVGYRLLEPEPPVRIAEEHPPALPLQERNSVPRRVALAGLALAAVALAAIAAGSMLWPGAPATDPIAIGVTGGNQNSAELASGLAIDLAKLANARSAIAFGDAGGGSRSEYVLTAIERRIGSGLQADLGLARKGSRDLLWSASFAGGARDAALLRQRAALAAFRVTECAFDANSDSARSANDLRVVFSGCERLDGYPDDSAISLWRRIVAAEPRNARALATLAFIEAARSTDVSDEGKASALRAASLAHLKKARLLNGKLGLTYAAEATLVPLKRYDEELAILERGLVRDPDCSTLLALKSYALLSIGFMDAGTAAARRASDLDPGYASYRATLALALAYSGFKGTASGELAAAERIWPDSPALREAQFMYDYRFGDAARLVHEIDGGRLLPNSPAVIANGLERAFLLARAQPTPENIASAEALALKFDRPPHESLQALVTFGHVDRAYALMRNPRKIAEIRDFGTYILFRVNMRPFVLDRRFMALADRLGLAGYWLSNNAWPDFCDDKDLPYDCKAEAQRLHAGKAA